MPGTAPSVLVIGAGPGGLSAAMLLAKAGVRVTVLEKQTAVGGRTATFSRDGFRFDLGPTFFSTPGYCRKSTRDVAIICAGSANGPARSPIPAGFRRRRRATGNTERRANGASDFCYLPA
ncbi:MAG: FAD-dependent oxidoreductase [Bryobacteraceae bacterium]